MSASISANPPHSKALDARGLRIAGLTPYSSIDYPGCLSAVVWIQGCPWRCSYCHNPHLQSRTAPPKLHWDEVMAFLRKRVGLLDAVVFSGGEATTDRHLGAAMAEVKALGYKVGLHTAGCYPERLAEILPLIDWVGLDVKAEASGYERLTGVPASAVPVWHCLRLLGGYRAGVEVRTTIHPSWIGEDAIVRLATGLYLEGVRNYSLQMCRGVEVKGFSASEVSPGDYPSNDTIAKLRTLFPVFNLRR